MVTRKDEHNKGVKMLGKKEEQSVGIWFIYVVREIYELWLFLDWRLLVQKLKIIGQL